MPAALNAGVYVGRSHEVMGRTQPDHRQPHQYARRPAYERGKAWRNAKGVDPDVHHAGGVPVVVRGRESLTHGEGEQFNLLGVQIT